MQWRILDDVRPEHVRELLSIARRRRFERNEVVFHRDDPGDSFHLVEKGRFAIQVVTPLGDRTTIAIRGPGDSFGEMSLIDGGRRSATVLRSRAARRTPSTRRTSMGCDSVTRPSGT